MQILCTALKVCCIPRSHKDKVKFSIHKIKGFLVLNAPVIIRKKNRNNRNNKLSQIFILKCVIIILKQINTHRCI